ncbi:hypothetical protein ACE5D9_00775 [Rickettsia sp. 2024-CO-Wats]|uniref:hypothetical protein n=1 Tax=unclassified Rickettsia TaxID=114295 RepID=UPI00370D8C68
MNRYSILLLGVFSSSAFNFSASELLKKYFKGVFKTFAKTYNLLIGILLKPSSYFLTWRALISKAYPNSFWLIPTARHRSFKRSLASLSGCFIESFILTISVNY